MSISAEETQAIEQKRKELLQLYFKVKKYLITSEKVSEGNRLSIPAINELRNAFDHEMRSQRVLNLISSDEELPLGMTAAEYCLSNISKAIGHVYRAGYDALDIISLSITADIERVVGSVSRTSLVQVFPDYVKDVRQPLQGAMADCEDAKASKDVESGDQGQKHFERYESAIKILHEVRESLYARLVELGEVEKERLDRDAKFKEHFEIGLRRERNIAYILAAIGIFAAIVIAVIAWIVPPKSELEHAKDTPLKASASAPSLVK